MVLSLIFFSLLAISISALPVKRGLNTALFPIKRNIGNALLGVDFPDPSLINVGGTWYAHATSGNGYNVQIARSSDFNSWTRLDKDALPTAPSWANPGSPKVWAPDVIQRVSSSSYTTAQGVLLKV
jgi:beta-xylosidase